MSPFSSSPAGLPDEKSVDLSSHLNQEHDEEHMVDSYHHRQPNSKEIEEDAHSQSDSHDSENANAGPSSSFPPLKATASNVINRVASRMTTRSIVDPGPPPDGGLKAWTQVAMGWLVLFNTWGYVNSFGAFQTYYTKTLHLAPPATISWIGSVQVWLTFFVGAFSGRLLDAGFFLPTLLAGVFFQLLGIFMMSLSTQYWQLFLTQGVLTGLGCGILFCPSIGLIVTYFDKNRALAVALTTTGNSTGGIIYPLLARELLPRIGFAWTTRVLGFMNLAAFSVVIALMRPRLPPRKSGPLIDWSAFKEPPYVLFVCGMFFVMWASYFVFYYIASFGVEVIDMTYENATVLVMILNGVGVVARLIPPFLADRFFGVLNTFVPMLFLTSLLNFCWMGVTNRVGFYIWTVCYGMANSAFQCLIPTTTSRLTPDLSKVGTRLGMAFSIFSVGALTGAPVGGALLSVRHGSYIIPQAWSATAAFVGFVLVFCARISRNGFRLAKC